MAKYEIMAVVDGMLDDKEANEVNNELKNLLKNANELKIDEWGNKQLAYPIQKRTMGYYFVYNFDTTDTEIIREFRRLTNINKKVLRFLIINLDKNYGAKALQNPKKTKKALNRKQHFEANLEKIKKASINLSKFDPLNKKKIDSNLPGTGPNAKKHNVKKDALPTNEVEKTSEPVKEEGNE